VKAKLCFESDTCQLATVRKVLRNFFSECGIPDAEAALLVLAVDEACTNVIRHAYGNQCRKVRLEMQRLRNGLRICLRDYGASCDPGTIRPRALEDIRPGGLGVHIIRKAFDEVTYTPCARGTRLTLFKRLPSSGKSFRPVQAP